MPESGPMLPRPYRIQRVRRETSDTFTWELSSQSGPTEFHFAAGQFNMLYVFGCGEIPISISGDPASPERLTHTIRAVGSVTHVMRKFKRGDVLAVRGPYGSRWPIEESEGKDILIAAGGLGLAPLRPVIYYVLAHRERFGRVSILYGTRTPSDILYERELEQWRARFDLDVLISVSAATKQWHGSVGWITDLIPRAQFDGCRTRAFICGPEVMMRVTARELGKRGIVSDDIFISMERNMKCAVGFCGHCLFGPVFICKDGPVFPYSRVRDLLLIREL